MWIRAMVSLFTEVLLADKQIKKYYKILIKK